MSDHRTVDLLVIGAGMAGLTDGIASALVFGVTAADSATLRAAPHRRGAAAD
ncbi:hypothetical protein [Streptomyces sp. 11x1]|uniref:hypothetical protein n=1 Tax=Streptomyces sp. 11x1 TaxID=3038642 RepID=UPI00292F003E|nr:hypothetical protein [Streptomyces sp. 11x1]WNZ06462.1 hypothetical protein P8T65_01870 [Streptomyces sp. 11x1]